MSWRPTPDPDTQTKKLREAIEHFLTRGGHAEISLLSRVNDVWESAVGTHVAGHVQPTSIANDTLYVNVDEPAWSTELVFIATRILTTLEDRLGQHVATFLKARIRGGSGVE
jgi:predicted nucleic acid-binding Zn ribbon protein